MKKIVILTPSLGMGGMERVLVNYANLFIRHGYDVTVLNLTYHDDAIVSDFDERVHYQAYYMPVRHLLKAKLKDIIRGNFRLCGVRKWTKKHRAKFLYKKFIREKYDIEIAFFGGITAKIISGSTNSQAKKFAWIHSANIQGLINDIGTKEDFCNTYNAIENVICVSNHIKEQVELLLNETHLAVLHNPHDTQRVRHLAKENVQLKQDAINLINVSRLDEKSKGFIRLLNVCKRLNDEGLIYHLWIVGDGVDAEKIKSHSNALGLKNVHFLGQQSNPYKYVQAADLYVCSSYYEGFSMTMMEAVILAKPILTTNVSGATEMLGDSEYGVIVENNEEALFNGLKGILLDKALYAHYLEQAKLRKDYFNEEKVICRFEELAFKEAICRS